MTIQLKELQLYLHYYVRKYMRHHLPKIIKLIRLLVCVPLWLNLRSIVIILISGQLSLLFFYQIGFFLISVATLIMTTTTITKCTKLTAEL